MATLLFTDHPNIDIYVDLALRDIRSVLIQMMGDVDAPEEWYYERQEAVTFDEDMKESLSHFVVVLPELPQVMRYLHSETGCSFHLAYTYGRRRLMEYLSDTQESLQAKIEYLGEEDW